MEWKLFADLAEAAGDKHVTVDVGEDPTVGDALDALFEVQPALEDRVLTDQGRIAEHINLLLNGTNVHTELEGLETAIEDGDELALFPPVSGG